jgi:hypothetical protein
MPAATSGKVPGSGIAGVAGTMVVCVDEFATVVDPSRSTSIVKAGFHLHNSTRCHHSTSIRCSGNTGSETLLRPACEADA